MYTKDELIEYSNKRSDKLKFKDYDDYIFSQVKRGLSFEKDSPEWANGQRICIENKFKNLDRNLKILDICCGDGVGLSKFKEMGFNNVFGAEICDEKIEFAKKYAPVIKTDICSGPFNFDTDFDIIYSSHSIEHVLNPEYTINNIVKFLKDDGTFFLILPYPDLKAANPIFEHNFKIHCGTMPLGLHIRDNGTSVSNIIKNMGFHIIDTQFYHYREPEIHLTLKKII
jgi:2-polyprenyl-3-methyl-5-hydroxy-6-metoxy-1,4-benzoquinol methylase